MLYREPLENYLVINRLARPMADTAVLSTAAVAGATRGTNNGSMGAALMRGLSWMALALALVVPGLATAEIKVAVVDGEWIALEEEIQVGTSRIPRKRHWYRSADDGFLGTDTLVEGHVVTR